MVGYVGSANLSGSRTLRPPGHAVLLLFKSALKQPNQQMMDYTVSIEMVSVDIEDLALNC
jgi:hypothetical protein